MREIKFRLIKDNKIVGYEISRVFLSPFNKKELRWVYRENINDKEVHTGYIEHDSKDSYTGLKDKNGKEIYEGDIVLIWDEWTEPILDLDTGEGPTEPCNHLSEVIFFNGCFQFKVTDKANYFNVGCYSIKEIEDNIGKEELEVIGNIWENGELLK